MTKVGTFIIPPEYQTEDERVTPEAKAIFNRLVQESKIIGWHSIVDEQGNEVNKILYADQAAFDEHKEALADIGPVLTGEYETSIVLTDATDTEIKEYSFQ